jgi:hypothetical protein
MGGATSRRIIHQRGDDINLPTRLSAPHAGKKNLERSFSFIADNYKTVEEVYVDFIRLHCPSSIQ